MRHPARARLLLRVLLVSVAFPAVYLGGASAAFYYRERLVNASVDLQKLPQLRQPDSKTRLLVFAPHCDDETLGCAGLIQQTLAAGGHVETVIITNGDGYPTAVERQERVMKPGPRDYIRFASLRQSESKSAMGSLGLGNNGTLFLGYPDQGLFSIWNSNWNEDKPYTSKFTECAKSPYADTFNTNSMYCGSDLVRDLRKTMINFHPTMIVVSHPAEDHPDHAAASSFVTLALQQLKADPAEQAWSAKAELYHYLVHRGDWPTPQGNNPGLPLAPPAAMMAIDTDWSTLPLTTNQVTKKAEEIAAYPSQTAIMPAFLSSFARRNELFGSISLRELPVVRDGAIQVDDSSSDWTGISPSIEDPARDNVLRDLQGGGDLLAVYCARDRANLYLRLKLRCAVSSRFQYLVRIRPFGPNWKSPDAGLTIDLGPGSKHASSSGTICASSGTNIEASIPWKRLIESLDGAKVHSIAVSAETWLSSVQIDRSETRLIMTPSNPGGETRP